MIQLLFAFLAGILTIGAPCILPMLPILLGTSISSSGQNRSRPVFITIGFVLAFGLFAFLFGTFTQVLGLSAGTIRTVAVVMLAVFGFFMLWPKPFELLTQKLNGFINVANRFSRAGGNGNFGALLLGLMLGVIWTPCAGPVLGTILTLVATKQNALQSIILLSAYAIGAGVPMLLIAYGGQFAISRVRVLVQYSKQIQQVFGVLIILLAVAIYFQYDTLIQSKLVQYIPTLNLELPSGSGNQPAASQGKGLGNYGPAPEFAGISNWLNSQPLTMSSLRGKVVLVDFWTYSCINCIRTLPYVTQWDQTYRDKGLVVIGIHTPEFAFEKDSNNVAAALKRFNIQYPVAQDNEYGTWNAFHNNSWPAHYLIDQNGTIVYEHFGEGEYDVMEQNIQKLLGLSSGATTKENLPDFRKIGSPETYFGLSRQQYMTPDQTASQYPVNYTLPKALDLNQFAFEGVWKFNPENAELTSGSGKMEMRFSSSKVYMVAESPKPVKVKVLIDGKETSELTIQGSQLYPLFESDEYKERTLEIDIPEPGIELFTLTFG